MYIKFIGAAMIMLACGSMGFRIAANYRREIRILRGIAFSMDRMACELQYRLTPLPELCRMAAAGSDGITSRILHEIAREIDSQIAPNVSVCVKNVIYREKDLPRSVFEIFRQFGQSLGSFDIDGQLKGIEAAKKACEQEISRLSANQEIRLRSYQTLGICAGAAIIILFI